MFHKWVQVQYKGFSMGVSMRPKTWVGYKVWMQKYILKYYEYGLEYLQYKSSYHISHFVQASFLKYQIHKVS